MSTGQTRTYPFLQKDKTAVCLPVLLVLWLCFTLLYSWYHLPTTQPLSSFVIYPVGLRRRLSDGITAIRY